MSQNKENENNQHTLSTKTIDKITFPRETTCFSCKVHSRTFECFCSFCKEPICPSCLMFGSHKNHQVQTFEEALKGYQSDFDRLFKLDLLKEQDLRQELMSIKHLQVTSKEQTKSLKKLVRETFQKYREALSVREEELCKELSRGNQAQQEILEQGMSSLEQKLGNIKFIVDRFDLLKKSRLDFENFFLEAAALHAKMNDVNRNFKNNQISLVNKINLDMRLENKSKLVVPEEELLFALRALGEIQEFKKFEFKQ